MLVRMKLLDKFLVVFVSNFNRVVWVYTRLKEVVERKIRKWRQEKCRLQLLGSRQLGLIANHLARNYLSNFIHHFALRNKFLCITLSLVYHLTTPDSFYLPCFLVPSTPSNPPCPSESSALFKT